LNYLLYGLDLHWSPFFLSRLFFFNLDSLLWLWFNLGLPEISIWKLNSLVAFLAW